ncbi:MAG TPA: EamA family transporter RarD [Candidatus Sericytochromatia bacterium]
MSRQLHPNTSSPAAVQEGVLYAVLAYTAWGLLPVYWKFFGQLPAIEVLSHRILWSMVFLIGLLVWQRRSSEFWQVWRFKRKVSFLLLTALLLTFNWGLYIYGVNTQRVVETSLGYFINPLANVLLGFAVLKERLNWGQQFAVLLASLGVVNFVWQLGTVPWIALGLAFSFAFYGLVRKLVPVSPMVGLAVETLLAMPVALAFIGYQTATGTGHFSANLWLMLLLIGAGVVTSFPLLWFNNAAKRLRLSTLGFFQYIAPSLQLMLGIFLYHESFSRTHAVTFGLIWLALLTYSTTSFVKKNQ